MSRDYRLYLDDIIAAIERIREFTGDRKSQDAVVRNLEIIGEASRALPEDIKMKAQTVE